MSPARPLHSTPDTQCAAVERPSPLTEAELGALVGAARGRGPTAVRNRALVALLAGSGCKPGEALRLVDADVDLEERTLTLHRAADGFARVARLLPAAVPHVEAWRLVRARLDSIVAPEESEAPFFCTRAGGTLEASYLRRLLPRLAKEAGLDRPVNSGLLRATFAAHVYRLGASLPEVQRLLGHSDSRSTLHLVRPVLEDAELRAEQPFRPDQWSLPGAAGTLRVELTVRESASMADDAGSTKRDEDPAQERSSSSSTDAGEPRTVVSPARWREL